MRGNAPHALRLAAVLIATVTIIRGCTTMNYDSVPARKAAEMIQRDSSLVLLDVRTPEEYAGELGHLQGAILIPVQELQARVGELDTVRGRTILVYCRSGRRSLTASEILVGHGHVPVNVEGGMIDWNEQKLPGVEYGKR